MYSIGPETNTTNSNLYDSNKISVQTKLMNIANHNTNSISNFLNLSKAESSGGKYYSNTILHDNPSQSNDKEKLTKTLKKNFCENISMEVFNESVNNTEQRTKPIEENPYATCKKDRSK